MDIPQAFRPKFFKGKFSKSAGMASILLMLMIFGLAHNAHADFPSPDILADLQKRLLEKPECYPSCASVSQMRAEASATSLTIRLEIHVVAASAVALPGSAKEWMPTEVFVDGLKSSNNDSNPKKLGDESRDSKFARLSKDENDRLWIELDPGVHQVVLSGPLPQRPSVQIDLPWKVHSVTSKMSAWALEGLDENDSAMDNLTLTRSETNIHDSNNDDATQKPDQPSGNFAPFVQIERHLILGVNWEIQNKVVRLSPVGAPLTLMVPLLEGESVTMAGFPVENEKVRISLSAQETEKSWHSQLLESPTLHLKSPETSETTPWVEIWQLETNPIWHARMEGLTRTGSYNDQGLWIPEWHPWPGEEVTLSVFRPEAVDGQTLTIDQSRLVLVPGSRSTKATLNLVIRSSLGGQHVMALPAGAELESVTINNTIQAIRPIGTMITLPLTPGAQNIEIHWDFPTGLATGLGVFFQSPLVQLGVPSVNATVQMNLPPRWILLTWGPRLGPAVLFWGFVLILILIAQILGKITLTPLRFWQWFLLGLGLTQVPVWASLFVVGWALAMGWRNYRPGYEGDSRWNRLGFDLFQVALVLGTIAMLAVLVVAIQHGLLWSPDMQIAGNSSQDTFLQWFQDRSAPTLPRPWVISVPLFVYRIFMLAWALWIATSLLKWLKWSWACFTAGGVWKRLRK